MGKAYLARMSEVTFTEKEFNAQVCEFRKLFGDKLFWAKSSEQRDIAVKALGMAYLFLEKSPQATVDRCADILQQTLTEYNRRELMLLTIGGNVGK